MNYAAFDQTTLHESEFDAREPLSVFILPQPFGNAALVDTLAQEVLVASGRGTSLGKTISVLEHVTRAQPFPHGGINE